MWSSWQEGQGTPWPGDLHASYCHKYRTQFIHTRPQLQTLGKTDHTKLTSCSQVFFHFCFCPAPPESPSEHSCFEISGQKEIDLKPDSYLALRKATAQMSFGWFFEGILSEEIFFFLLILPSAYSLRLKSRGTQGDKKKNWLVRLTKAESQTKLLGLQIKMLAWIKCLVKILKLSFSFHLVEYLLRHHVNAGKSLTWCGTVQPPTSWLAFGTLTSLRLFPQSWVLWDGF